MNLEQLRKQAKELVRAARDGDERELARLGGHEPILASAQLALAREHGYPSWPALVAAAEADADAFVVAATTQRRDRADAMLAARPELERDPWAGLVLGRGWDADPNTPGGPRGWPPVVYLTHSAYAPAGLLRELLERGGDPNATYENEYGTMSALYGAAGILHDPELTRILLEAGADPDDNESLYHSTEAPSSECLRLLLEHGAETEGTNALAHALDEDRIEHVRLLLEHGANPNYAATVAHAVRRGRGPEVVRLLVEHGADVDRPGGETWRGLVPLRTPYRHAVLRNMREVADELARLGASTDVAPEDLAVAAVARGERAEVDGPFDVDQQEVLILSALHGNLDTVVEAVGPDFSGVVGGSPHGPLLGHAAWVGSVDAVRALLDAGADPSARTNAPFDTPLAIAALGSQWHRIPGRDYVGVAELLVEAGAVVEPRFLEVAHGPLEAWLERRLA
jgi:hypothetical protein